MTTSGDEPDPPAALQETAADRPGTVTAAGVILLVGAGLGILACGGLNYLAAGAVLSDQDRELVAILSAVLAGAAVLGAALGLFVLRGRQWARVTTIVVCVLGIVGSVASLFTGAGAGNLLGTCLGTLLNVLVIGLLSGSAASDYFRRPHR